MSSPAPAAPRAVYIHVPFCRHRCGYCNFTLVAGRDDLVPAYLDALAREMGTLGEPRPVDTIFFGGGTPTHLNPPALKELLALVNRWFLPAAGHEWSVEANPADMTAEKADLLQAAGVTRLSLGAQSFATTKLLLLERDHTAETIARAMELARPWFASVSLDLIFGAPGETLAAWQADLAQALALAPQHISTYGLTFEKGTTFWSRLGHGEFARVAEEAERDMYLAGIDTLTAAGFEHYEVSNFALPGQRCRHNEQYWLGEEYYAFGPGAARYVGGRREMNHRSTTKYIERVRAGASPVAESETLAAEDRARELLVFGLRRLEGVDREWFAQRTGYEIAGLGGKALTKYIGLRLLEWHGPQLRLTRAGLLVSDAIWPEFLEG